MAHLAEERAAWVATPFAFRYTRWAETVRELAQRGELGKVSHIRFRMIRPGVQRYRDQDSGWMLRSRRQDIDRRCEVRDDDRARVGQRPFGERAAREPRFLRLDRGGHRSRELAARRDQQHLRSAPCSACETDPPRRTPGSRRVGDHEHLGRPRRKVARCARGIAIDLRLASVTHVLPGPKILSTFGTSPCRRPSPRRLRAAELEHALDAGDARRVEHGGVDAAVRLHGAAQNPRRAARETSRHTEHQRGGGQGRIARRHVQPTFSIGRSTRSQRTPRAVSTANGCGTCGRWNVSMFAAAARIAARCARHERFRGVELRRADLERIELTRSSFAVKARSAASPSARTER